MSVDPVRYKATKLDGRYAGYRNFSHYITITTQRGRLQYETIREFNKLRDWCHSTWGSTCELYDYEYIKHINEHYSSSVKPDQIDPYIVNEFWSYYIKDNVRRIYLTEKAKVWFDLTW